MSRATPPAPWPHPASPERGAWDTVRAGWTQIYGNFEQLGVSVELHDFRTPETLDWGRSFHPKSVELCLNLAGEGRVSRARESTSISASNAACYAQGDEPLRAQRAGAHAHRFVTLEFNHDFLQRNLAGVEERIDPVVRRSVFNAPGQSAIGPARALTDQQRSIAQSFVNPPVAPPALPLWYQSKVLETLSVAFFPPSPELFCARQKRLARDRVERVRTILRERLEDPPSLEELGREVGVSPFHLSRTFSQEMSATIPQYLRRIRMERAAELLRDGRYNVTETAFAVGYSSLGHFSRSFCEVIGCCPTLYPKAAALLRR